ncbi:hypothetical protein CDAR_538691 [Caerostris darwini]|uniref:Uncharacterized protein n=1 Tax=Caerostris darwini TaxID=1538125 RepID=A0AAV4T3L7_9ARAC|nr:hypothetical protein CDAR_538691 [Caerostris darwini]
MAEFKIVRDMRSGDGKSEVALLDIWEFEKHFKIYSIYSSPGSTPDFSFLDVSRSSIFIDLYLVTPDLKDNCKRLILEDPGSGHRQVVAEFAFLPFRSIKWSINLMEVKSRSDRFRRRAELSGSSLDVQAWRRQAAVFKKSLLSLACDQNVANSFMQYFADSQRKGPFARRQSRKVIQKLNYKVKPGVPEENDMTIFNTLITIMYFNRIKKFTYVSQNKKVPRHDGLLSEFPMHLGPRAFESILRLFNKI